MVQRSTLRSTINLHVEGIPQFPLHLPSGVYLTLLSGESLDRCVVVESYAFCRCTLSSCHGFEPAYAVAAALSPMSATFPSKQYATLGPSDSVSQRATPTTLYTPASATFPHTPASAMSGTDTGPPSMSGTENTRNPFNFQSVTYQPGRPQAKQNVRSALI